MTIDDILGGNFYIPVVAAYGRKYLTETSAMNDWKEGKDFKIAAGSYMSIRDSELLKNKGFVGVAIWISKDTYVYCDFT